MQESLGHQNAKNKENYLASFEKSVVKEFADRLTAFKDEPGNQEPSSTIYNLSV